MMKMKKLLAVLLALMLLPAVCGTAGAEQEARKIETAADADEWAAIFLGEHPEDLDGAWLMTPQMETAAAQLGGMKGMAGSLAALGTAEKIYPAYEAEIQGYQAFHIPCRFTGQSVDLVLVTDQGAIAGMQVGAFTGEEEERTGSDAFDSIELAIPVPALNGELPGTLTVPKGDGPFPAVILVHGSGSSDRDEAVMSVKPFRDLAEGLAERGIAVYRYDKRSYVYGVEMMNDLQITPEDETIDDAVTAVQILAQQERIDPSRIYVLGHSLGGNMIPAIDRALKEQPAQACGYIMMAASPRPLDVLMREQYEFLYSLMPEITEEQQAEKDAVFAELDRLQDPDALTDEDTVMGVHAPYWKWLAAYDALEAAKEMTAPVLLLQGEEDYQVTMTDFGIWQEALGEKENWQLISYPGLTHPFTPGQKAEGSDVYSREAKVDPGVMDDITAFVAGTEANP